ncbi:MAG: cell division protein FtsX [Campylobacterota bacterium]|nr:cell division protein FtsX [Campylobacterota bacterium]
MKRLNAFFSFTIPLIVLLCTFSVYLLVSSVVDNYKNNITNDYAIVVISNTPIGTIDELADIDVKDIEIISREKIIKGIKDKISESSLNILNKKLPYFYKIYLEEFPTTIKLEQIRKELYALSNIKKVETFSSDHNKIYSMMNLIQSIVVVLFTIVLVMSFLLLSKQIKIWFFEHKQRIDIIQLHGGTIMYSSKPILKTLLASSFFSAVFVSAVTYFVIQNIDKLIQPELISLIPNIFSFELGFVKIVLLSFIIPMSTFFALLIKYKIK